MRIESYRSHPDDHQLLGVCWEGQTYVDLALPFGLRSAPKLFMAVADALGWALMQAGAPLHIHYLDDYLFFLPPGFQSAQGALLHIITILDRLGVSVSTQKIERPSQVVTFLGIVIDTIRGKLRLPAAKVDHIRDQVRRWLGRRSVRYTEFESLLGHLSHATTVIRQGRIFLQHLFVALPQLDRVVITCTWTSSPRLICCGGTTFCRNGMVLCFFHSLQSQRYMCIQTHRAHSVAEVWFGPLSGFLCSGRHLGLRQALR